MILAFSFKVSVFVDFVKHGVLTLVDKIWHYRNGCYYYYCFFFFFFFFLGGNVHLFYHHHNRLIDKH